MTKKLEIYKCNVCGNIVEVVHEGMGELVCCNEKMQNIIAGTTDAATEKHVPVIEKKNDNYLIKVGSVAHPMEEKHYIEWIQIISGDSSYRTFLKPGVNPEAEFKKLNNIKAREYCNIHGLWEAEEK